MLTWLLNGPRLNILGLLLALAGILLLFRYGMPYKTRTGGHSALLLEGQDQKQIALERPYARWGWVGLVCIVVGTLCQIIANLVP